MLKVYSVTFWETPNISTGLHANMSLLRRRKSMSALFYLGFKPAPIWMVLVGSSASICKALASLPTLKVSDEGGMAGSSDAEVAWSLLDVSYAALQAHRIVNVALH
jgi:hypothetical protein